MVLRETVGNGADDRFLSQSGEEGVEGTESKFSTCQENLLTHEL